MRPGSKPRSVALWLLSGIYLILQALVSFGCGGYLAGRCRILYDAGIIDDVESRDGLQGFAAWALAAVISAALTALVAMVPAGRRIWPNQATTTEPSVLSYEIDAINIGNNVGGKNTPERKVPANFLVLHGEATSIERSPKARNALSDFVGIHWRSQRVFFH